MNDYISRDAVLEMLEESHIISNGEYAGYCTEDIDICDIPSADVQPIKHGHWVKKHRHRGGYRQVTGKKPMSYETHTITIDERYEIDDLYCSECGKLNESVFTNFCPNCGADMRESIEPLQNAGADAAQFADQPILMPAT